MWVWFSLVEEVVRVYHRTKLIEAKASANYFQHSIESEAMCFCCYRPPATVLAKPAPIRNRKDSSDAEPSPPNSPSYFEEDVGDHVSSITVSLKLFTCKLKI